MGFKRKLCWLILVLMPLFFPAGCGDLEPDMQDTRTVVLKMDFNQRSSSRSSQISQAEVSSHKTHLILALPSWENLSSNYRNYYSSFAQELMNPSDNKVSLEIPLNTQMKIFAFLFKQDYTMPQMFSGVREVGYYGESQPFTINAQTNNLSLGITLQSAGTTDDSDPGTDPGTGTDTTPAAPVISGISSGTFTTSQNFTVNGDSGATIQYSLDGGTTWLAYSAAVTLTNEGSYTITARQRSDAAGNWSVNATYITVVINQATDTTAPTVSVMPATITSSDFAVVQSTETGTAYLVNTSVTVSNRTSIENAAADNMSKSVVISAANTNTNLAAAGLVEGTYKAYAEDAAENLSDASLDNVTIVGLVDIDGNAYRTVVIGTQTWMAENLKVTKYRNEDNITDITISNVSYAWYNNTDGAYGYSNDSAENIDTYGMLYNWYAVDNSSDRYICPQGWHVPTDSEFSDLEDGLESNPGAKLKEKGTVHWESDPGTSNPSGFAALPAGYKNSYSGIYFALGTIAYFWTSSSTGSSAKYIYLRDDNSSIFSGQTSKKYGFSVRCLKD